MAGAYMQWDETLKIIGGCAATLVAWQQVKEFSKRKRQLSDIKSSVDIYAAMPEGWDYRELVRTYVETQVQEAFDPKSIEETEKLRFRRGLVVIAVVSTIASIRFMYTDSPWALPSFFAAIGS